VDLRIDHESYLDFFSDESEDLFGERNFYFALPSCRYFYGREKEIVIENSGAIPYPLDFV
jgi:hypothetical protein